MESLQGQSRRSYQDGGGLTSLILRKCKSFCLPHKEGGDTMDFITWNDLIQVALLVLAIISCFYNKKR